MTIIHKTHQLVKKTNESIITYWKIIFNHIIDFKNHLLKIKNDLGFLAEKNLELGKFHFNLGNSSDAWLRFKLVEKFFDKGNIEAHYYLAWNYLLDGNRKKALAHIENCQSFSTSPSPEILKKFIKSIDNIETLKISDEIYNFARRASHCNFVEKFGNNNVAQKLIELVINNYPEMPEECKLLDIASNIGFVAAEAKKRLPDKTEITALETCTELSALGDVCFKGQKLYDHYYSETLPDFINNRVANNKFDLVTSIDYFGQNNNLALEFELIKKLLSKNGVAAMLFRISASNTKLDYRHMQILHTIEQIDLAVSKTNLQVIAREKFILEKNQNYYILLFKIH